MKAKVYVQRAIDRLNVTDSTAVRSGYNLLRSYIKLRERRRSNSDNIRFYFSSYFLKQVGDIRKTGHEITSKIASTYSRGPVC
ncbi:unnamed protein product [Leptidea sinapis]|uniref:Uncharacterized protein n=1 Tax=Leptidea sinapis TaxID=189913 RepID=A0A5E4QRE3_9NEOP|nr:unnamed protein product [Leptidea sinapis]